VKKSAYFVTLCVSIALRGFGEAAQLRVNVGECEVSGRVVAAQLGCPRQVRDVLLGAPERAQHLRHVERAIRVAAVERERAVDELDRGVVTAALVRDQAEQMKRVRMVAIEGEQIAAGALGFVECSGAEMRQRGREQVAGKRARTSWRHECATRAALACCAPILAIHGDASAAASLAA
jgi:hypothetical protein